MRTMAFRALKGGSHMRLPVSTAILTRVRVGRTGEHPILFDAIYPPVPKQEDSARCHGPT